MVSPVALAPVEGVLVPGALAEEAALEQARPRFRRGLCSGPLRPHRCSRWSPHFLCSVWSPRYLC
jgi:hypothetical protein